MPSESRGQHEITLLQERNSGTFAQVYLARAKDAGGLRRIVAVKLLKERWTDSDDILNRTRDEAQLLASLQHQNIVRVDAITEIEGRPAIIMEFVHGLDLAQLLKALSERNDSIAPRAVYEMAEGIASALAAAWFKVPIGMSEPLRVVHRDLKPSNVMIGMGGELKVLDFGTARFEDAGRAAKTEAIRFGSLKYMSPERREGERGDHASDLYSLGLLILELLGGRIKQPLPIDPEAHNNAFIGLIDAVPDFGLPNSGWDNSLRETLLRLCATDPEQRLDARQTVKLMRAFKEQANGDGLVAYAEEVVAPLTGALNAIPDLEEIRQSESDGEAQFLLHADGRTSVMARGGSGLLSSEPDSPQDTQATGFPEDLPTTTGNLQHVDVGIGEDAPTQSARPSVPLQSDETNPRGLRPGFALHDLETEELLGTTDDESEWVQATATTQEIPSTGGKPKRLPPPRTAQPSKQKKLILIGCAATLFILMSIGGGSMVLWMNMNQQSPDIESSAPTNSANAKDILAETFSVELHAGDPTVQWIRLSNAEDERLLTARPDASGNFGAGTYTLSVKVMARSVLNGTIEFNEDISLTCKPATMGRVRCSDANGNPKLLLRP